MFLDEGMDDSFKSILRYAIAPSGFRNNVGKLVVFLTLSGKSLLKYAYAPSAYGTKEQAIR